MANTEEKVLSNREKLRRKRTLKRIIWLVILLILLCAGLYCYNFYMQNQRWPWVKVESIPTTEETVKTQVYESVYQTQIDLSGSVEAYETQEVKIRATGAVTGVFVKEGDRVQKGQLLATVDDTDQQYSVANLEKELQVKQISGNSGTKDIELLQMQLDSAKRKLEYTKAYANFDGVVVSVSISEGDYFDAGSAVMTIIDDSKLKATVEIDEIDIQMVETGMKASLTSDAVPGQSIDARVSYIPMIGRYSSQGIGVMDVEIVVDNPPAGLKPGFSFEGVIDIETEQSMLLVAQAAVTTSRGVSSVEKMLEDGSIKTVVVQIKYLGENVYQIISGDIKAGDTVVYTKATSAASSFMNGIMGGAPGPSMGPRNF